MTGTVVRLAPYPSTMVYVQKHDRSGSAALPIRHAQMRAHARRMIEQVCRQTAGVPPSAVVTSHPSGQPRLDPSEGWSISISHSDPWVGVALSRDGSVGVDVEPVNRIVDFGSLLRGACAPSEAEHVECADDLLRRWTAKEALLKAAGCGLSVDPRLIEIGSNVAVHPQALPKAWGELSAWRVESHRINGFWVSAALAPRDCRPCQPLPKEEVE